MTAKIEQIFDERAQKIDAYFWKYDMPLFGYGRRMVEIVAWNLGGGNPNTSRYYSGDTPEKLLHYNGTVIKSYPGEVLRIMAQIGAGPL